MEFSVFRCFILIRQKGFRHEIKIKLGEKKPFRHIGEPAFQLFPDQGGLLLRSIVEPITLNRMYHRHTHVRFSSCEGRINSGKMIFYHAVFLIPGRLIENGCGIIPLGFSVHAVPGKVVHTQGNSKGRLPVSGQLMSSEIKIPVRHTIKLAEHAGAAILMGSGLRLLRRSIFPPVAKHVNSGHLEASVRTHGFSQRIGLRCQRRLFHHMSGKHDSMVFAPVSDGVREGGGKLLRHKVMETVTGYRYLFFRQIPDEFRHCIEEIFSVGRFITGRQAVCIGKNDILPGFRKAQCCFMGKLRLIRKNGRNCLSEFITDTAEILFMGFFNKPLNSPGIERIHISFIIIPRAFPRNFLIQVPYICPLLSILKTAVFLQAAIFQGDIVAGKKLSVPLYGSLAGGIKTELFFLPFFIGKRGEHQISAAVFHILCNLSPGCS